MLGLESTHYIFALTFTALTGVTPYLISVTHSCETCTLTSLYLFFTPFHLNSYCFLILTSMTTPHIHLHHALNFTSHMEHLLLTLCCTVVTASGGVPVPVSEEECRRRVMRGKRDATAPDHGIASVAPSQGRGNTAGTGKTTVGLAVCFFLAIFSFEWLLSCVYCSGCHLTLHTQVMTGCVDVSLCFVYGCCPTCLGKVKLHMENKGYICHN